MQIHQDRLRMKTSSLLTASLALAVASSASAAGTFSTELFTNDADSGIAAAKAYALAINNSDIGNLTINNAVFTGPGNSANPATNNYAVTNNSSIVSTFNPAGVSGDVNGLFTGFGYKNGGDGISYLTLNNLRVGQAYRTTFYNADWGGPRVQNISVSDGGSFVGYDQDGYGAPGDGHLLHYDFVATANTLTFDFAKQGGGSFHHYAFSNQVVGYKALLTDNFYAPSNPNTSDVNFNLEARQGGTLAAGASTVTYTSVGNNQVGNTTGGVDGGNYLLSATGGATNTALNQNFNGALSDGGMLIGFDVVPVINGEGSSDWSAINLGLADANKNAFINAPVPHFGILFRDNGGIQAFDGNAVVSGAEQWTTDAYADNDLHRIELLLTDSTDGNPFDGVGQTEIEVFANGVSVFSFTKGSGGYADNFINLDGIAIGGFDNLLIAQVPEPTSLALLGLGGLLIARRRR